MRSLQNDVSGSTMSFAAYAAARKVALEMERISIKDPDEIASFLKYHTSGSNPYTTCCTQCWNSCCNATYITPAQPIQPPINNDGDS